MEPWRVRVRRLSALRPRGLRRLARLALGLAWIAAGGLAAVLLFHFVVMPSFVRHGQETVVPDVRGLPARGIGSLLGEATLVSGQVTEAPDEHIPPGRIVRQSPPPGARVKRGRSVDLVVSLGPSALRVPDLEGESLIHARFLLAREGIGIGRVRGVVCAEQPPRHIVAVSPPSGTSLAGRTAVDLLISDGPAPRQYLMPDLQGHDAPGVAALLEAAGLLVTRRVWPDARGRLNEVVEQTPPAGYPIREGGTVEIRTGG